MKWIGDGEIMVMVMVIVTVIVMVIVMCRFTQCKKKPMAKFKRLAHGHMNFLRTEVNGSGLRNFDPEFL
jgi:hypothetical protein